MTNTPIEWTDFSVNPIRFRNKETGKVGHFCEKISPGCKNCYSAKMQTGPYLSGLDFIAENKPKGEFFLDENALQQVLRRRKPARIFWCDMTDMFLADYPEEWIDRCFAVMALTPHLTHQVLTKRADRMREYFGGPWRQILGLAYRTEVIGIRAEYESGIDRFITGAEVEAMTGCGDDMIQRWTLPLPNVHLGVSVEDQQRADERIPLLLQTPAAVRFLSVEPLLGPVDLSEFLHPMRSVTPDWVIVGGESGPGARPCDVQWIRSIKDQCQAAGVPVFVKQLGHDVRDQNDAGFDGDTPRSWPMDTAWSELDSGYQGAPVRILLDDRKGGEMSEWPADLQVREMPQQGEAHRPDGRGASNL